MITAPINVPEPHHRTDVTWISWACLAAAGVILIGMRFHAFDLPLETDECNYAYIAGRLLEGDRLYVDVWDHQPFGVFALFAGVITIFGDSPEVFRWLAIVFSLLSLGLIHAIVRLCAGGGAALAAALMFAIVSSDPGTAGEGCNREIYMNTLILLAWYLALRTAGGPSLQRWGKGSVDADHSPVSKGAVDSPCGAVDSPRGAVDSPRSTVESARSATPCGWRRTRVRHPQEVTLQSKSTFPEVEPPPSAFAAGFALAVGSSIKTIVAVHWVFLALWIGLASWRCVPPEFRVRSIFRSLAWFAAAPAVLWVGAFGYFAATERLGEFVDAVFLFNLSYSGQSEGFLSRFGQFFTPDKHPFIFDSAWPLWVGGAAGFAWLTVEIVVRRVAHLFRDGGTQSGNAKHSPIPMYIGKDVGHPSSPSPKRERGVCQPRSRRAGTPGSDSCWTCAHGPLAIVLLVTAGYFATCLPGRFWPHYYYLLIPALVLSLSVALASVAGWVRGRLSYAPAGIRGGVIGLLYALVPVGLAITEYGSYVSQPLFGITVTRYNSRDFWGRAHGENVRRITEPDDTIFVFGNEAEIYYYSRRRCASRYTMITGIQSGYADAPRRRATMMADLEQNLPRLILVLFDEEPFAQWKDFLDKHYGEPIGWDFHDSKGEPIMFVLARKDQPVDPIDWNWDRKEVGGWPLGERR